MNRRDVPDSVPLCRLLREAATPIRLKTMWSLAAPKAKSKKKGPSPFMAEKALKGYTHGSITTQEFNHLLSLAVHGSEVPASEQELIFGSRVNCMPAVRSRVVAGKLQQWQETSLSPFEEVGKPTSNFVKECFPFNSQKASPMWVQVLRAVDNPGNFLLQVLRSRDSKSALHTLMLPRHHTIFFHQGRGQLSVFAHNNTLLSFSVDNTEGVSGNAADVWPHVLSSIANGHSCFRLYFGAPVDCSPSVQWGEVRIPLVLSQCIKLLKSFSLRVEGLFRQPGDAALVQQLVDAFECQNYVNLFKSHLLRFDTQRAARPLDDQTEALQNEGSSGMQSSGTTRPDQAGAGAVASLMKR